MTTLAYLPTSAGWRSPAPREPHRPGAPPDPARFAAAVARAYLEVEAGRRPLAQLSPLLAPALRMRLAKGGGRGAPEADVGVIQRVHHTAPSPHVHEAVVIAERAGRVTALCLRFERHHGAWRLVELARPESAGQPTRTASRPHARSDDDDGWPESGVRTAAQG